MKPKNCNISSSKSIEKNLLTGLWWDLDQCPRCGWSCDSWDFRWMFYRRSTCHDVSRRTKAAAGPGWQIIKPSSWLKVWEPYNNNNIPVPLSCSFQQRDLWVQPRLKMSHVMSLDVEVRMMFSLTWYFTFQPHDWNVWLGTLLRHNRSSTGTKHLSYTASRRITL